MQKCWSILCLRTGPLFFFMLTCLEFHFFCFLNLFFNFWYLLGYFLSIFDPKNLSKINQKNVNFWAQWQDEPKRAIRSFKEPKSCIFKNLKKPPVFEGFWVRRPPKRASRDPRRLPRGTQRAPKPPTKRSKIEPKNSHFFWLILDKFWGSKMPKKLTKSKPFFVFQ